MSDPGAQSSEAETTLRLMSPEKNIQVERKYFAQIRLEISNLSNCERSDLVRACNFV